MNKPRREAKTNRSVTAHDGDSIRVLVRSQSGQGRYRVYVDSPITVLIDIDVECSETDNTGVVRTAAE